MSAAGVRRLRAWVDRGALLLPDADEPNLVDLARALAADPDAPTRHLTPGAARIARAIRAPDHVVLVLVDGLGMEMVERQAAGSFLRSHAVMELRTVAPSSTAPALTSLATGAWPAEHAVPGWFTYLPEPDITALILPYIERYSREDARRHGAEPTISFPVPAQPPPGRQHVRIMPRAIDGSVYSLYSGAGGESAGYDTLTQAIEHIRGLIASARESTFTYLYVPFVDAAEHTYGPQSRESAAALGRVSARLETLAHNVAGRATIVVTADHGLVDVPPHEQTVLRVGDPLLALLRFAPTCEPRLPAFHVEPGRHAAFEALFEDRFGEHWALLTLDEADAMHLFGPGPCSAETRRRLGDYVAISDGSGAILHRPSDAMLGFHGGLTPDEMRIPLIIV